MGKRWLFSFSTVEKTSGTSKQDEGIQVSRHTLLLRRASTSDGSKAGMAAPRSTPSSTGCLPSRDSQHTDLGCHHVPGCCSVPAAVKQARKCSYTSMGVCGQTLHASLPGFLGKVLGLADSWSAKPAHISMQSWRLSVALCMLFTHFFPDKHHVCQCLSAPLLPHPQLFPSEEKEKQAEEYVWNYLLWLSSRKWHTQESVWPKFHSKRLKTESKEIYATKNYYLLLPLKKLHR